MDVLSVIAPANWNLSGTYAAKPAAGVAGRRYSCDDSHYELRDNGSSWDHYILGRKVTEPSAASLGWRTQGSATLVTTYGGELVSAPAGASANALNARMAAVPATPYANVIGLACSPSLFGSFYFVGWSDGTGYAGILFGNAGSGGITIWRAEVAAYNSATTYTAIGNMMLFGPGFVWFKLSDNGSAAGRKIFMSTSRFPDDANWNPIEIRNHAQFLTPTHIGYAVDGYSQISNAWLFECASSAA